MTQGIAAAWSALALGSLLTLAAAPVASAQEGEPEELRTPEHQEIGMLFVHNANRGTAERVRGRPVLKLKLRGVSPQVVWFQDRPGRHSGPIPIRGFVRSWAAFGFMDVRPNAALTLLGDRPRADTAVLKLSAPRYRPKKRTIRYFARPLTEASGNLAHFESRRRARLPRRFGAASLFIDNATGQVIGGCVIQPYTSCVAANLSAANLSSATLTAANLFDANLSFANLSSANLTAANLTAANLTAANLTAATLLDANLPGANLTNANLPGANLTNANLPSANLTNANLPSANLHGASLHGASLHGADLTGANLIEANLGDADLSGADLSGADLSGADLSGAHFCNTTMPDGSVNNRDCP